MPKSTQRSSDKARHDPLHVQLGHDEATSKYARVKRRKHRTSSGGDDEDEDISEVRFPMKRTPFTSACITYPSNKAILDPKTSQRIFDLARVQQLELGDDSQGSDLEDDDEAGPSNFTRFQPRALGPDGSDDEDVEYAADEDADHAEQILVRERRLNSAQFH
jgi:essential nuclear protein 1